MGNNPSNSYNLALIGASSLKGKEVKAMLGERGFPLGRLALFDAEEVQGQLTEFEGEPAIIQPVTKDSFQDMKLAIFASSPGFTEQHWRLAEEAGCDIIDLSYFLETNPDARLRAPSLDAVWGDAVSRRGSRDREGRITVPAHPAAVAIAGLLGALSRRFRVERSVITVFEPVSERGAAGVNELRRQTVNLFAFQEIPRDVFDAQIAFNLLSSYGELCRPTLQEGQERIGNHVSRLLEGRAVRPALRLLQAPIFYGHAFCCFVELQEPAPVEEVEETVNRKPFSLLREPDLQPTVVGVAGSNEILLGRVESDPAYAAGCWIWGTIDNVRLAALTAVEIAEELVAS